MAISLQATMVLDINIAKRERTQSGHIVKRCYLYVKSDINEMSSSTISILRVYYAIFKTPEITYGGTRTRFTSFDRTSNARICFSDLSASHNNVNSYFMFHHPHDDRTQLSTYLLVLSTTLSTHYFMANSDLLNS